MFEKEVLSLWFCHFKFSNPISSWIWCTIPPLPLNVQKQFNLHCSQKLTFHLSLLLDYRSDSYHFNLSILISASKWFSSYKYIRAQTSLKRTKFFYFAAIYLSLGFHKIYIFYEWKRYKILWSLKWSTPLFGNKGPMFQNISLAIKLLRGEDKENILETVR